MNRKALVAYYTTHRKFFAALIPGAVGIAVYYFGPNNIWVLIATVVLGAAGVHQIPNEPASPAGLVIQPGTPTDQSTPGNAAGS